MYVIRDKNAKSILHISEADYTKNLAPEEVYQEFDPNTMEMGKTKNTVIPAYFGIDEAEEIVPLSKEEFESLREKQFASPAGILGEGDEEVSKA